MLKNSNAQMTIAIRCVIPSSFVIRASSFSFICGKRKTPFRLPEILSLNPNLDVTTRSLATKTMTRLSGSSALTVTPEDPNGEVATRLIHDLCSELSVRYGNPPSAFSPDEALAAGTAFVVARLGGQPIGCGGLRRIDEATVEIKRMYVAPHG